MRRSPFSTSLGLGLLVSLNLLGCATRPLSDSAPRTPVNVAHIPDAVPRSEPLSKYGNPASYEVNGHTYTTRSSAAGYVERGIASWYGTKFHGHSTSSGEPYDMYKMTAAHRTLPLPCYVQVSNLQNGRQIVVRVNDRGPFHPNRIIDLSYAAARKLGIDGTGMVEVRSIDPHNRQEPPVATVTSSARRSPTGTTAANPQMFVQAGAFSNRDNAEQLQQQLHALLTGQHVSAEFDQTDKLYRVRIGPLSSVDEADKLTQLITANGFATPHLVVD